MLRQNLLITQITLLLFLVTLSAGAVEVFKVSQYNGGHQIWFEAEAFDERNPDTDQYFVVTGGKGGPKTPKDAFGETVTRSGGAGGMIRWTFDISKADGVGGTWYFWGRMLNPSNQSDYMLVLGDPDDKKIPKGPPFPGGDGANPFINADDRVFEQSCGSWCWWGNSEGSTKELQDGENTMYIFHRQGNNTVFWDVFMWSDNNAYRPSEDDYVNATEKVFNLAVQAEGKLAILWGRIKQ